jgi:hypothetical protein
MTFLRNWEEVPTLDNLGDIFHIVKAAGVCCFLLTPNNAATNLVGEVASSSIACFCFGLDPDHQINSRFLMVFHGALLCRKL